MAKLAIWEAVPPLCSVTHLPSAVAHDPVATRPWESGKQPRGSALHRTEVSRGLHGFHPCLWLLTHFPQTVPAVFYPPAAPSFCAGTSDGNNQDVMTLFAHVSVLCPRPCEAER